jgi:hypothetical protein
MQGIQEFDHEWVFSASDAGAAHDFGAVEHVGIYAAADSMRAFQQYDMGLWILFQYAFGTIQARDAGAHDNNVGIQHRRLSCLSLSGFVHCLV